MVPLMKELFSIRLLQQDTIETLKTSKTTEIVLATWRN